MSASSSDLETGYLLACLAHGLDSTRPWPHPPQGLDWQRMQTLVSENRLTGLFHALGRSQSNSWPEEFREPLRIERYRWLAHAEESRARVHRALSALTSAGLDVIVLKGWAYIYSIYACDPSRRLCSDVDLLVRPRDADAATIILRSLGCTPEPPVWPGYAQRYHNGEIYFFSPLDELKHDAFSVGLHWGLLHVPSYDAARVDTEGLFTRACRLTVAGVDVLNLGETDSIVYACAHLGLHHRFEPDLFRYYDIAALICAASSLDWEAVARTASTWDVILPMRRVLGTIVSFWPDLVSEFALREFEKILPNRREWFVHTWLLWTRGRPAFNHLLLWLTFPDWKQRLLIVLQDIFPGPEYLRRRYGSPPLGFWPFLYLRRFTRALGSVFWRRDT